jgi:plastocyanin
MKRIITLFVVAALALAVLAACGGSSTSSSSSTTTNVGMGGVTFDVNSVTITKGSTITFTTDASSGSTHNIVVGTNGHADTEAGAPDFGTGGQTLPAGKSWTSPPWNTAGTFHVTCTFHPTTMTMTVVVTG